MPHSVLKGSGEAVLLREQGELRPGRADSHQCDQGQGAQPLHTLSPARRRWEKERPTLLSTAQISCWRRLLPSPSGGWRAREPGYISMWSLSGNRAGQRTGLETKGERLYDGAPKMPSANL